MIMNKEIHARDINGTNRCYGIGETRQQAIKSCIEAAKAYLIERPDIDRLYLYDGILNKPIYDAAKYQIWEATR